MTGNQRHNEYIAKTKKLYSEHQSELSTFMEKRRNYTKLDEGVSEERAIRKKFWDKMNDLRKEYEDVL